MDNTNYLLEQHFQAAGSRPQRKFEETITTWDRDIFWYNRDEVNRQTATAGKITYEDHRKVIEIAVSVMRKKTQHGIAMCILTHRYFTSYRAKAFAGLGSFTTDYSFLIKKISALFNPTSGRVTTSNIASRLKEFTKPTLVQVNHIASTVTEITPPANDMTLNEWAIKYSEGAPESTTYILAGLSIGTPS